MDTHVELLVFSDVAASGGHRNAVEVLTGIDRTKLNFDDVAQPHMEGAKVLAPVMVFKEGDYVTLRRNGSPARFKADRQRMERWIANTVRDSAINYDHKRTDGPNTTGWLRVATGNTYLAPDPRDGKLALWSQPELGPEALNLVQRGHYRDMSIEIDPETETIVGLALTNYPRVKNITQFSEGDSMPVDETPQNAQPVETPAAPAPERTQEFSDLQARLAAAEAKLAQQEADRQAEREAAARELAETQEAARRAEFSEWVQNTLIKNEEGESVIPVGLKDKVVELMVFAEKAGSNVVLFSDTDDQTTGLELLKTIFGALERVKVVGESAPSGVGPSGEAQTENFGLVDYVKNRRRK